MCVTVNDEDSWIEKLNEYDLSMKYESLATANPNIPMMWLVQQGLPRMELPKFDGNPMKWVEFVIKFKELVHDQAYLKVNQKFIFLIQHMEGQAKRAIQVFSSNKKGYILALKRLKYMFGQRSQISQAYISKLTRGKKISNDDDEALMEYYYTISDCVVTLNQLNYVYDLHITDVLRQTIRRLPSKLHNRWAEYSFQIRKFKEPSLTDLESWLQERILASKV